MNWLYDHPELKVFTTKTKLEIIKEAIESKDDDNRFEVLTPESVTKLGKEFLLYLRDWNETEKGEEYWHAISGELISGDLNHIAFKAFKGVSEEWRWLYEHELLSTLSSEVKREIIKERIKAEETGGKSRLTEYGLEILGAGFLSSIFSWSDTKKGCIYWSEINETIKEINLGR